jgi:hypothetical protein
MVMMLLLDQIGGEADSEASRSSRTSRMVALIETCRRSFVLWIGARHQVKGDLLQCSIPLMPDGSA